MPYLTPETDSIDTICFSITVPNTQGYRIVVAGLLETLYFLSNWEQFGLPRQDVIDRLRELNPNLWEICMLDCQDIANCIDTSVAVQNTLNTTLIALGIINSNVINSETTIVLDRIPDAETLPVAETSSEPCDLDFIWAGIRSMVERIDGNGRDILEDLVVVNDKIEQWGELIDLVPILGDTIKDIGDLFTQQLPDILNQYNSASSPTFLDSVACDLFQMVCNECRYPTFDEILNYFGSHSYVAFPDVKTISYAVAWDIIKAVPLAVPEGLWYTINTWQCLTLALDGIFGRSYGQKSFEIWASFGEDNPNDNWEILCDGCDLPYYELYFDFAVDDCVPPFTLYAGNYENYYYKAGNLASERLVYFGIPFTSEMYHTEVEVDYRFAGTELPGIGQSFFIQNIGDWSLPYTTVRSLWTQSIAGLAGGNTKFRATTARLTYSTVGYLFALRFKGNGYVPTALVPYMVSGVPA